MNKIMRFLALALLIFGFFLIDLRTGQAGETLEGTDQERDEK